jgi:predicted Rossmann-fold nucleotide-binding protein
VKVKVISGGQTGVDRAALDAAMAVGLTVGGWCPRGRRAENGPLPERYPLRETPTAEYRVRTEWNVRDSDGTLILAEGPLTGGTLLTLELARDRYRRPVLVLDLGGGADPAAVVSWVVAQHIRVLNVAGPPGE